MQGIVVVIAVSLGGGVGVIFVVFMVVVCITVCEEIR